MLIMSLKSLFCFQMGDIVTEKWMHIQRLEQAVHITEVYPSESDFTILYDKFPENQYFLCSVVLIY